METLSLVRKKCVFGVHCEQVINLRQERWENGERFWKIQDGLVDEKSPINIFTWKKCWSGMFWEGSGLWESLSPCISSHSERFAFCIYFCTLILGLCEMLHFRRIWGKWVKMGVLKRWTKTMKRQKATLWFVYISLFKMGKKRIRLLNTWMTQGGSAVTVVSSNVLENVEMTIWQKNIMAIILTS